MRHWNYRVIKTKEGFQIHEVDYDEKGNPIGITEEPVTPFGLTKNELRDELRYFQSALGKPSLEQLEDGRLKQL